MKFPIFVLGAGRCGTTLTQEILNTHPDVHIEGEHSGFLEPLSATRWLLRSDIQYREMLARTETDPWAIRVFGADDADAAFRQLILDTVFKGIEAPYPGFKEIHYGSPRNLAFLRKMFPDARYIAIHRNPADTLVSMARSWDDGELKPDRVKHYFRVTTWLKKLDALHLDYDTFSDDDLPYLFGYLGLGVPDDAYGIIRPRGRRTDDLLPLDYDTCSDDDLLNLFAYLGDDPLRAEVKLMLIGLQKQRAGNIPSPS